jgi:hypothetical protein
MSLAVPRIKSYKPVERPLNYDARSGAPLVIAVTIPHNFSGPLQIGARFLPIIEREPTGSYVSAELMPRSRGRKGPKIPASQSRSLAVYPAAALPAAPLAAPPSQLGYDPTGPMEQRDIVGSKDGWSEYILNDKTVIRAKVAMIDVKRAAGQFNTITGEPIYVMQMTIVTNVIAPDELKKKNKK